MALTNAEKQRNYRKKRCENFDCRIQSVVSLHIKKALERLSRHHGITQQEMLKRLIDEEDRRVISTMNAVAFKKYVD
jgi:NAD(P)H-flavin reductase